MEIVVVPVEKLRGYENNARTHSDQQINELALGIKQFGFLDPIEINTDFTILSGHARLSAAIKAGLTHVPTICHNHLDDTNARAYTLAANRIALSAGWDDHLVGFELKELDDAGFDLKYTGFSDAEIEAYLNPEILQDERDEDSCPGVAEEAITRPGDIWLLGKHRLMCGDSTMVDNVQSLFCGHHPTLMITDPPYGVNYDPVWREESLREGERSLGKVENDDMADWKDAYSLFPGDICYVWHAGKYSHIVAQNIIDCGFDLVSQIIWSKNHFAISRGDYHWQHEACWYAVRKGKKHNWCGKRDQSTVWEIQNTHQIGENEKVGHGTQKPVACMEIPLTNNSKLNDYVYDPFGGSGTTLIACEKTKRNCLMMEISPKYCDAIVKRWEKFTGNTAVLDSSEGLIDETR